DAAYARAVEAGRPSGWAPPDTPQPGLRIAVVADPGGELLEPWGRRRSCRPRCRHLVPPKSRHPRTPVGGELDRRPLSSLDHLVSLARWHRCRRGRDPALGSCGGRATTSIDLIDRLSRGTASSSASSSQSHSSGCRDGTRLARIAVGTDPLLS